jgi:hypothetical protein
MSGTDTTPRSSALDARPTRTLEPVPPNAAMPSQALKQFGDHWRFVGAVPDRFFTLESLRPGLRRAWDWTLAAKGWSPHSVAHTAAKKTTSYAAHQKRGLLPRHSRRRWFDERP